MYKIDSHGHANKSRYPKSWKNPNSFDYSRRGDPKKVILSAAKKVDGIVIAQQNNLESSLEVVEISRQLKKCHKIPESFLVYAGEEIATPMGEFIGIGHQEGVGPYCPKNWKGFDVNDLCEAMDRVREQGGVVIADHPLSGMRASKELVPVGLGRKVLETPEVRKRLDGMEVLNYSAYSAALILPNYKAQFEEIFRLQRELGVNPTGGTDNHFRNTGLAYTLFESEDIVHELRKGRTRVGLMNKGWPDPLFYLKFAAFYFTDPSSVRHAFKSVPSKGIIS